MKSVGRVLKKSATFYVTGGATALLFDFREGTIDIDIAGDMDELFSSLSKLKERLHINIELAKPTDFIPSLPGEKKRHITIGTFGKATFMHFDPYAQAFSKIVRGHKTDVADVKALATAKLVDLKKLSEMVKKIPDSTFAKYPRLNRPAVEAALESFSKAIFS
ncbi:MAG: hypothetical protein COX62_02600 [Deltaproteobacteria bacterium CG_4_10_14_0_2_um_filter_43_8]|nr:MAG: hypothetical protein COV43_07090 [Deltaproteobacteria bacterium CG11_big_fil_rev_8_21_14_0_20_42_23]PJA21403.1 MAG: hypothetical protein COX62_02600 [Deltaproteobacteria bacterium CG_4_10_14_0_2_um_filter_43_8]PJC63868.1 MAG: hypothetical protein CO021_07275 [Deltaproteobacteria bacterium CG_4_9_14_0_2_um_filter_42_21]